MTARHDGVLLPLYRTVTRLLTPAAGPFLRWRLRGGKEDAARLGERTGRAGMPRPQGFLVWMHGASLGEGLALQPLLEQLTGRGLAVLITTGTLTSAGVLGSRLPAGAVHQFVPLDLPLFVRRFLDHWRPDLVLLAESELWPNLVVEVGRRGVPLAVVNARMSPRSFARWRKAERFIAAVLSRAALCLAQSEADAERLAALGAARVAVTGNLKFDAPPPPADPEALATLAGTIGSRPVWLAASTHLAEEPLVLAAHRRLAAVVPGLLTVVVPRRLGRGPSLAEAAAGLGLVARLRSRGQPVTPDADLYVADTVGELGLFYRCAEVVFVGKSLAGGGGQNPIEAGMLRRAIVHGPEVGNFVDVYRALDAAGGALQVDDVEALVEALRDLLSNRERTAFMAEAAAATVNRLGGATARTMQALAPYLPPASDWAA